MTVIDDPRYQAHLHQGGGHPKSQPPNAMGRGEKLSFCIVKYIFFGFNVFIWFLGCGVLSLGVWLHVNRGPYMSLVPAYSFLSASSLCITAGCIILIVGFLGCCGAFLENQCMLIGYFVLVLLIFTLEVTAGTLGIVKQNEMREVLKEEFLISIQQDYHPEVKDQNKDNWRSVMNSLQKELHCCGINNYTDWYYVSAWPNEERVPDSCCVRSLDLCGQLDKSYWYNRGCLEEIEYWFIRNMYVLGVVGITVAVIQILAMVAAIILFCYLRSRKYLL
ncbi:hypothetical protein SNE40_003212 [Patella caerulea]|uniref:Tetraspanin n=2 Tax=Patella caerulea TaxID=87958 RepID=A0AAN8Q007_PATCE